MRVVASPPQVQNLLEKNAMVLMRQGAAEMPSPTPAEGQFSGGSPLKAHTATHSPPAALRGGNLSGGVSLQTEKEKRA